MNDKFFVIVGNGLGIDLFDYLGIDMSTASPFSFDVPYKGGKLFDELQYLRKWLETKGDKNDYDVIDEFIMNNPRDDRSEWIHCDLRRYLSMAYSYVNGIILEKWKPDWKWQRWMNRRYSEIVEIVSFNYDLVLETMLKKSSLDFYRVGSLEEKTPKGLPIFKPHGSCDFDITGIKINSNIFKNFTYLNQSGLVKVVTDDELYEPRTEADIVLPFEYSPQCDLSWIKDGYELTKKKAKEANRALIIGISYMECDRNEINSILENLKRDLLIQYVSPKKNPELELKLKTISKNVESIDPNKGEDWGRIW